MPANRFRHTPRPCLPKGRYINFLDSRFRGHESSRNMFASRSGNTDFRDLSSTRLIVTSLIAEMTSNKCIMISMYSSYSSYSTLGR